MANEPASTGVAELDRALDGLYWGGNVVWAWEVGGIDGWRNVGDSDARCLWILRTEQASGACGV
jgi:hypothetical protein